jgi:hypothetical protein
MARLESVVFCDGCGVEITVAPVVQEGKVYCCKDCADGYECDCASLLEQVEEERHDSENIPGIDDLML